MGMAASQARYLALVARKSNCEYEGQQINQSRLILSNQSANLFNQMLGLQVPIAPSKQDFTVIQYSFKDGSNTAHTMTKWVQLDDTDTSGYNYAVTYHYNKDKQVGSQIMKSNPQVQFSNTTPSSSYSEDIRKIEAALKKITECEKAYDEAVTAYNEKKNKASLLTTYSDTITSNYAKKAELADKTYTVTRTDAEYSNNVKFLKYKTTTDEDRYYNTSDRKYYIDLGTTPIPDSEDTSTYVPVTTEDSYKHYSDDSIGADLRTKIDDAIAMLKENGAVSDAYSSQRVYYSSDLKAFAFATDLEAIGTSNTTLPIYYLEDSDRPAQASGCVSMKTMEEELRQLSNAKDTAKGNLDAAKAEYNKMNVPKYIGNTELTAISELSEAQKTAISKIIADLKAENIDTRLSDCFEGDNYIGGIFSYENKGITYYVTYYDLADSALSGTGINNIDGQVKLPIYSVQTINVAVDSTEKALLETDMSGRFISIRLESDSTPYELSAESDVDEDAYTDAMHEYDYQKAVYDKRVADLNAQTSLIQRQDQDLELRLKQLDTEQNALSTEIDAVSKVVKDNVEKSFKTFGG